jgi:hypothetical protein
LETLSTSSGNEYDDESVNESENAMTNESENDGENHVCPNLCLQRA